MSKLSWLRSLVKHNVAAKHRSSKPLTSNELWLLELRIKSIRILALIPDALWDMCKSSIMLNSKQGHWHMQFQHLATWALLWFENGHSLNTAYLPAGDLNRKPGQHGSLHLQIIYKAGVRRWFWGVRDPKCSKKLSLGHFTPLHSTRVKFNQCDAFSSCSRKRYT